MNQGLENITIMDKVGWIVTIGYVAHRNKIFFQMPRPKKAVYLLLLMLPILIFAAIRFFVQKHPFFDLLEVILCNFVADKWIKANSF